MCIICIVIINIYWLILISTGVGWKVWGGGGGGEGRGDGGWVYLWRMRRVMYLWMFVGKSCMAVRNWGLVEMLMEQYTWRSRNWGHTKAWYSSPMDPLLQNLHSRSCLGILLWWPSSMSRRWFEQRKRIACGRRWGTWPWLRYWAVWKEGWKRLYESNLGQFVEERRWSIHHLLYSPCRSSFSAEADGEMFSSVIW